MERLKTIITEATDAAIIEGGAGIVKEGRAMKGLVREVTSVAIFPNDPQDESGWRHQEADSEEVGGGRHFKRRFTVQVRMFLQKLRISQEQAYTIGHMLMERIESAIEDDRTMGTTCRTEREVLWSWVHAIKQSVLIQSGGENAPILEIRFWLEFDTARNN
jgi:hypothetical protein